MVTKICVCCGNSYLARPQVPNQTYCAAPGCQQKRRKQWQRNKMLNDPDYRDNQSRNQRAWFDRNPNYWRAYRNKSNSRPENHGTTNQPKSFPLSGLYRITFSTNEIELAKSDAWNVKITPVCMNCPCKKDACKDRT